MAITTEYLTPEITTQLYEYQVNALTREINDYLQLNAEVAKIERDTCPKCGSVTAHFTSGGYTVSKHSKHMLKCSDCHRRFVEDHGQLTYYSHSDAGVWNKVIEDTLEGKSLASTAAQINHHTQTVFRMRHKLLEFIEHENECTVLSDTAVADEKYVHECHKGLVKAEIDERTKTIAVEKKSRKKLTPGLGDDKTCIITAVQREGRSYIHTENMGKLSSEDVKCLSDHIEDGTFVFTDGCTSYEQMLKEKNCPYQELVSEASYDSVNHLNYVNSFHSKLDSWLKEYHNVNTIYTNRYNALFSLRHKYAGCDIQESAVQVLRWLRSRSTYFFQRQLQENIFDKPFVMGIRENLIGMNYMKS